MTAAIDLRPYDVVCDVSDRDAWLESRTDGIGASEIAAVLGESPWMSPLALYASKIGAYERDLSDSEPVYWGTKLEGAIVEAYSERTGRKNPPRRAPAPLEGAPVGARHARRRDVGRRQRLGRMAL